MTRDNVFSEVMPTSAGGAVTQSAQEEKESRSTSSDRSFSTSQQENNAN